MLEDKLFDMSSEKYSDWTKVFKWVHELKLIILDSDTNSSCEKDMNNFRRNIAALCQTCEIILPPNTIYFRARKVGYGVNGILKESDEQILRMIAQNSNDSFQGFDAKNSLQPLPSSCKGGRTNKAGISHLFLCESREATIAEVKPIIGEYVSIAEIANGAKRKIIDLTLENAWHTNEDKSLNALRQIIAWELHCPLREEEYRFTQYLCDYINKLGYEGVRFSSAAAPGHVNIAAFNLSEWYVQKTDLVQVKNVEYSTEKIPYSEPDREMFREIIDAIDKSE